MEEKTIKVLQVLGSMNMGGAECRMMDVYRHINRTLYDFDFVSFTEGEDFFEKEIRSYGGEVHHIASPRGRSLIQHFRELYKCIRNGNYDVVHAHTSFHSGIVMLIAWICKVPVRISHSRNLSTLRSGVAHGLEEFVGKILIKMFATKCVAISVDAGKYLFGRKKYQVIPNAIDTEKYQICSDEKIEQLKKEIGIPSDCIIIGQVGRFSRVKNHRFTIDFFEHYLQSTPNAVLVFVGGGLFESEIEEGNHISELVKSKGLKDKVIFTGVRSDIPDFIHVLDTLIFPSFYEGLGGVAIEAQAAGVPVVENEELPKETDLGIGLVEKCSLNAPLEEWKEKINLSVNKPRPTYQDINRAFDSNGFSIEATTQTLCRMYRNENIDGNNNNI